MKKFTCYILTAILLLSSFNTILFGTSSLAQNTDDAYFETATNWGRYGGGSSIDGTGTPGTESSNWKYIANTTAQVKSGETALKILSNCTLYAIPLTGLTAGKDYTLSFYYYAPEDSKPFAAYGNTWFDNAGIFTKGTAVEANGYPASRYAEAPNAKGDAEVWNQYTVSFTANDSELFFGLRICMDGGYTLYLDEFSCEENKEPSADDTYFETATNWGKYRGGSSIDGTGTPGTESSNWNYIANTTAQVKSGETALKILSNCTLYAIPLTGLTTGKDYTLSFYYYAPEDSKPFATYGNTWFDNAGIFTKGTAVEANGYPASRYAEAPNAKGDAEVWNQYTVSFTANDSELFFGLRICMDGGYTLYLDEFSCEENKEESADDTYFEVATNWGKYRGGSSIDGTGTPGTESSNWNYIANTTAQVKSGETALKILSNCTLYAIPLTGLTTGKDYTLSFYYYAPEDSKPFATYGNTWFDNAGIFTKGTAVEANGYPVSRYVGTPNATGDTGVWKRYVVPFTANDSELFFGMRIAMDGGYTLYLDEFSLKDGLESTGYHAGAADVINLDFEKEFDYKFSQPDRIEVSKTTGIDGKDTMALHVKEGSYDDSTTFLNWQQVTTGTDPVFNIPVKENTPYRVSAWIRVDDREEKNNSAALRVFYDYNKENYDMNQLATIYFNRAMGQEWVEYNAIFVTGKGQKTVAFALDASHTPAEMWVDNIVYAEIKPGYSEDTSLSYCEDFYNLAKKAGVPSSQTLSAQKSYKLPVKGGCYYTFGTNLKGKGMLFLSYDEAGKDIIHSLTAKEKQVRVGFNMWISSGVDAIYLHILPKGGAISIQDVNLFATKAISLGWDMGYEANPNLPDLSYDIITVNGDDFSDEFLNDTAEGSPETGDNSAMSVFLLTVTALLALVVCIVSKGKKITN